MGQKPFGVGEVVESINLTNFVLEQQKMRQLV